MEKKVGEVIHVEYDTETKDLVLKIRILDEQYKRKILRDFRNADKLLIKGDDVMSVVGREDEED